jgi:SP family general alpha glucoside:H+ symporter-like MFS transporter
MSLEKNAVGHDHVEYVSPEGDSAEVLEARAKEAQEAEHALSPLQAIKAYPMALFWSFMVSMCVIMEGYDTIL